MFVLDAVTDLRDNVVVLFVEKLLRVSVELVPRRDRSIRNAFPRFLTVPGTEHAQDIYRQQDDKDRENAESHFLQSKPPTATRFHFPSIAWLLAWVKEYTRSADDADGTQMKAVLHLRSICAICG
jgi:hypothetical protein